MAARLRILPLLRRTAVACLPTADNVRGPMYRDGAPFRSRLCPPDEPGVPLVLSGSVTGARSCEPLPGALLDVWQTDDRGLYSNLLGRGERENPDDYRLRGRLRTDETGRYRIETILPGRYPLWILTRPRHIHFEASHAGHRTLVTQVFFAGDRYLRRDPWVKDSLVIALEPSPDPDRGGLQGVFDIVLEEAEGPEARDRRPPDARTSPRRRS